ncbi:MAG TPA: ABC transporter permease [Verrucomicrobiae bacterium]|jgi:putative ABC transport system permease protein|nr:ABC transporter permease [Verrucomicrobiae bacterium]
MNRSRLFFRLMLKDAWVRKDRAVTALLSVVVVATMATVALTIYSDLEGKLSHEFRSFGANVIVTTPNGSLSANELAKVTAIAGNKSDVVPIAYAIGTFSTGQKIVVGGADLGKLCRLNSWWSLKKENDGPSMIGSRADTGGAFTLTFGSANSDLIRPGTVFTSGSDDDSRLYVPLEQFVRWTRLEPSTALVRVDGRPREIESAVAQLRASLPHLEVEPVRQIAAAQTAVLGKTRSVVLAASVVVVVLIMVCMVATFTSSVLERRKDFAVMKALGASNRTVNLLFAAQAVFLAVAGATVGYIAGSAVAFWIGRANFDAAIFPQPGLFVPVVLGSVMLALIAATAPIKLLQRIQPAGILRGE